MESLAKLLVYWTITFSVGTAVVFLPIYAVVRYASGRRLALPYGFGSFLLSAVGAALTVALLGTEWYSTIEPHGILILPAASSTLVLATTFYVFGKQGPADRTMPDATFPSVPPVDVSSQERYASADGDRAGGQSDSKNRKRWAYGVVSVLATILVLVIADNVGRLVGRAGVQQFAQGAREGAIDEALLNVARQINSMTPHMVDNVTRLDSAISGNGRFRYNYTRLDIMADDVDRSVLEGAWGPILTNKVCTTEDMRIFVDLSIPVTYAYYDEHGKEIVAVTVDPNSCEISGGE